MRFLLFVSVALLGIVAFAWLIGQLAALDDPPWDDNDCAGGGS